MFAVVRVTETTALSISVPAGMLEGVATVGRLVPNASRRPPSASSIVTEVFNKAGLRGFYRGFVASLMTHAPAAALFWSVYHPTKARLRLAAGVV